MSRPNIVILVLCSVRHDYIPSVLESDRRLARRLGRMFSDLGLCIAPSSWSLPSHASLLTGLYASTHGAHETNQVKLWDVETIALRGRTVVSELKDLGYKTYLVSANPFVTPIYGFNEFDRYFDQTRYFLNANPPVLHFGRDDRERVKKRFGQGVVVDDSAFSTMGNLLSKLNARNAGFILGVFWSAAVSSILSLWTRKVKAKVSPYVSLEKGGRESVGLLRDMPLEEPFFLVITLMEPHQPYFPNDDYNGIYNFTSLVVGEPSEKLLAKWRRGYQLGVRKALDYSMRISESLYNRYEDRCIIMVVSDHGQGFLESGWLGHGTMITDELVKTPFFLHLPKSDAGSISSQEGYVSLVNVRRFVSSAAHGVSDVSLLYSREVYAESFGVPMAPPLTLFDLKKYRDSDQPRKRAFGVATN